MRRIAAMFATALLAAAAALTAPAAHAAVTDPGAGAPAAVAGSAADNCPLAPIPGGFSATCTGIDPLQTWGIAGTCTRYDWFLEEIVYTQAWTSLVTGNTTSTALCLGGSSPWRAIIVFGPTAPAGPVGPITGYGSKCVGVKDGNPANGTPVQIWDCLGNTAQTWKVAVDGTVRALGKCLDIQGGVTDMGTPVQLYDCNGGGAQQWRPRADGSLFNPMSGRCLDQYAYSTTNGSRIVIWDCNGAANQVWHLPA
ncbi:ricin-type beta-trefoil lectin domain protein [Kitasatospora purpeofusca]|uniref:ricin-type beta-trefoil lectin domain protein n=1 Tax=Kitasatospora purpeofusca TaxID=67352 RepID=UPI002A5AC35E|nr:ricin-type beta-trefoil lectin domain protein [Kitasatospora purpeofusca]MDY0815189.1 ricin-type beta-trefoil lectin domain protein [Kitasatospora purpeofusca]